ncbi:10472_t:CDS:2 [Gigaspora margarita]|uniref:10472_t:CDS:1 n=1 Tax=Gigaspora margarita TaxID=4874 RepID=A0ABN7UTU9_GIGMA|nr:10472_t:CDS:2 [Gigaspora margarita]
MSIPNKKVFNSIYILLKVEFFGVAKNKKRALEWYLRFFECKD